MVSTLGTWISKRDQPSSLIRAVTIALTGIFSTISPLPKPGPYQVGERECLGAAATLCNGGRANISARGTHGFGSSISSDTSVSASLRFLDTPRVSPPFVASLHPRFESPLPENPLIP